MFSNNLLKIEAISKEALKNADPAHDFLHSKRVINNAIKIAAKEGGDLEILTISALLHDIINYPKNHQNRSLSSQHSAQKAEEFLKNLDIEQNKIEIIKEAILCHSFSQKQIPKTIEAKIFQDADRLDAIGAIGIARTFSTGAKFNSKFYNTADPFLETERIPDDKSNCLDHFFIKLFKLPELMQTKTGKKLAQKRINFMNLFLKNLKTEII